MRSKKMKTGPARATALLASLSMALPVPVYAQTDVTLLCADGSAPPCAAEGPAGEEPQEAEPEAQPEQAPAEVPAEPEVIPEPAPEQQPVPDEAPAPAPEEVPQPDQAPEIPAAEGESLGDALNRALQGDAPAAEQAPAEEPAAEEAPVQEPAEAPAADAPPAEEPAAEAGTEDALRRALEAEFGDAAADDAAPETGTEADTPAEAPAVPPTEAPAADATDEGGLGAALERALNGDAQTESPPKPAAEVQDGQPTEQMLVDQPDPASGEPPVAAALQALIGNDGNAEAGEDVEVMEQTVTEDNARSSSEDFENTVSARSDTSKKKDDRWNSALSDREKVMLLGLGALAVGAVISNNRRVELNSGDRVVVQRPDGQYEVIKDDDVLLRQPGSNVRTEQFRDGSSRTTVVREDGSRIVTIYSPEMRVLRRTRIDPNGREYLLIDDTVAYEPVNVATLPPPRQYFVPQSDSEADLRAALARESDFGRRFSLSQVRNIAEVRSLVPVIDVNAITFATGSAAITPDQARSLATVGRLIQGYIRENPREIFLIEGHTDAVGSAASNLALSDRRAESVALALTEYFDVPPENMVVQGYGESYLRVNTQAAEQANRRASVRRITDLLQTVARN
ncbi:Peptidoglycan-associated lipoprotein [Frigidibacter albus]